MAVEGGVLRRAGHTAAASDLGPRADGRNDGNHPLPPRVAGSDLWANGLSGSATSGGDRERHLPRG